MPASLKPLAPPASSKHDRFIKIKPIAITVYTHTHPAGAGKTLKGKRKKKADTDDGQKAKTAQEGEGNERTSRTNLRGETDLTGTGHKPKPHDTLQRGTGEELRTEWLVTRVKQPKQLKLN